MKIKEYAQFDTVDIVQLIRKKQVSAQEILETAIDQIEILNPKLNAVIFTFYDFAKEQLKKTDKNLPLYGTVILLKDSLHDI
jgi:amidase